jgi:hypothetical protein
MRLYRRGRRLVWAAGAIVTETVAAHRTAPAYRFVRTRREAQHYVSIYLDGAARPRLTAAELWLKGLAQTAVGAAWSAVTFEFGSNRRVAGRMMLANGLGKLRWMRPIGYIPEAKFKR